MHGWMFTNRRMDTSWIKAAQQVAAKNVEWVAMFGFELNDDDLNYIVNNKTRLTFDKEDIWESPHIRWHREGLSVWDMLIASTKFNFPEEGSIVEMHRDIGRVGITMWCRITEIHRQSREELGSYVETVSYSLVTARCILEFIKMEINGS